MYLLVSHILSNNRAKASHILVMSFYSLRYIYGRVTRIDNLSSEGWMLAMYFIKERYFNSVLIYRTTVFII